MSSSDLCKLPITEPRVFFAWFPLEHNGYFIHSAVSLHLMPLNRVTLLLFLFYCLGYICPTIKKKVFKIYKMFIKMRFFCDAEQEP